MASGAVVSGQDVLGAQARLFIETHLLPVGHRPIIEAQAASVIEGLLDDRALTVSAAVAVAAAAARFRPQMHHRWDCFRGGSIPGPCSCGLDPLDEALAALAVRLDGAS